MSSIYYDPQKFECTLVDSLDEPNRSYEFNMLIVVDHYGQMYWATDSGCSCPTPFERIGTLNDMEAITTEASFRAFQEAVNSFPVEKSEKIRILDNVSSRLYKPNDIMKEIVNGKNRTNK